MTDDEYLEFVLNKLDQWGKDRIIGEVVFYRNGLCEVDGSYDLLSSEAIFSDLFPLLNITIGKNYHNASLVYRKNQPVRLYADGEYSHSNLSGMNIIKRWFLKNTNISMVGNKI